MSSASVSIQGLILGYIYVWQSQVEIEHHSVAYFDRVTMFEALYRSISIKGEAHTSSKAASMPNKST